MKLAAIGVGNAGSRIVNQLLATERSSGRRLCHGNTLLINSTAPAFDGREYVPEERRLTIGDVLWEGNRTDISGNPDLGAEVAREERNEINRAFDLVEFHEVDGVLVIAGLGGGTGGGAGSVVIDQLNSVCDLPVFGVGVLPSESEGQRPALTASRCLQSFVAKADNVIIFDNDAWLNDGPQRDDGASDGTAFEEAPAADVDEDTDSAREPDEEAADTDASRDTEPVDDAAENPDADDDTVSDTETSAVESAYDGEYAELNRLLAERLLALFAAEEEDSSLSETRLDPSDIIRTLDTGGLSAIGFASAELPQTGGFGAWVRSLWTQLPWTSDDSRDDEPTDAAKINSIVRRAARSKLTLPCEISSAERALIVLSGPSRTLSRKGFESGRYWLEQEADIVDVMAGDEPHESAGSLTAVVLFSNVTEVPRIKAMQEQALQQAALDAESDDASESQPKSGDGSIDEWGFGRVNS